MSKTMVSRQAFPSLPPSLHAPCVSLVPKTPLSFPFQTPATQATDKRVFINKYYPERG